MDIPIIRTDSCDEDDGEGKKKKKKYEFRGSQSHRCSLVTIKDGDGSRTVKWSSVKLARKPSNVNGGVVKVRSPPHSETSPSELNRSSSWTHKGAAPATKEASYAITNAFIFNIL
ncbi:Hypothetical protein NTJ_07249 [Nesidiocoris tenuis]|uniref:Uncharacterized protein n=1 Tax=Nesidiocoris tenuis TaxID=355587 RepID=A0ABN7AT30_9HEMI|nr:Hypothetical protein NTJ_07249 [Nesidiocoris tenuis]